MPAKMPAKIRLHPQIHFQKDTIQTAREVSQAIPFRRGKLEKSLAVEQRKRNLEEEILTRRNIGSS